MHSADRPKCGKEPLTTQEVDSDANHPKLNDALLVVAINKQCTVCSEIEA